MRKQLFYLLLISIFLLTNSPTKSLAQEEEQVGLTISPVVFELNADPGDTLTNQLKVYNSSTNPITIEIGVEDFTPVGEEGEVLLRESDGEASSTFSLTSWTEVEPSQFTLQPKEQQVITFAIKVPPNGEPGGHYGSIVATVSGGSSQVTGSSIASKRGALVLLRVSGDIEESIVIDQFETDSFREYGPVDFELKFKNSGNVHLRPAGFITITDIFGKKVDQIEIPQNNVIPGAIRKADVTWEKTNLFGKYTATLVATYGNSSKDVVTDVITFTVVPWKQVGGVATVTLLLIALLYRGRNRIKKALKVLISK